MRRTDRAGQATVEAAFLIPILFTAVLMLVQPGIVLYDRMVMRSAASEGCRLLVTRTDAYGMDEQAYSSIIKRHLGAVPEQELFHVHNGGCSWVIELSGAEGDGEVSVRIANTIRLLPLIDAACGAVGIGDARGCMTIEVEERASAQPEWVSGQDPGSWVHQRG